MAAPPDHVRELDPATLLLIVVGAHLEAERSDRPLGYGLRERIVHWQERVACADRRTPMVCTDLWYLNSQPLRLQPTVSIGRPEVNAATAYLAGRLPTAFLVDESLRIQFDPEFIDPNAAVWGTNAENTSAAVDLFVDRYLDDYLAHVHGEAPRDAPDSSVP